VNPFGRRHLHEPFSNAFKNRFNARSANGLLYMLPLGLPSSLILFSLDFYCITGRHKAFINNKPIESNITLIIAIKNLFF
jgi:hypothetical protein